MRANRPPSDLRNAQNHTLAAAPVGTLDDLATALTTTLGGLPYWAVIIIFVFLILIILMAWSSLKKIPCPNCGHGNKRGDALCRQCFSPLQSGAYKPPRAA